MVVFVPAAATGLFHDLGHLLSKYFHDEVLIAGSALGAFAAAKIAEGGEQLFTVIIQNSSDGDIELKSYDEATWFQSLFQRSSWTLGANGTMRVMGLGLTGFYVHIKPRNGKWSTGYGHLVKNGCSYTFQDGRLTLDDNILLTRSGHETAAREAVARDELRQALEERDAALERERSAKAGQKHHRRYTLHLLETLQGLNTKEFEPLEKEVEKENDLVAVKQKALENAQREHGILTNDLADLEAVMKFEERFQEGGEAKDEGVLQQMKDDIEARRTAVMNAARTVIEAEQVLIEQKEKARIAEENLQKTKDAVETGNTTIDIETSD